MTERERLIELMADYTENITARELHSAEFDEKFADYLLTNGVVMLPCKVGDVVYCLCQPPKEETRIVEVKIDTFEIHKGYIILEGYDKHDKDGFCYRYFLREIGEKVFHTKEEAEKALERSETE